MSFVVKAARLNFNLTDEENPLAKFRWKSFRKGHQFDKRTDDLPQDQWDAFVEAGHIVEIKAPKEDGGSEKAASKSDPVAGEKK